MSAEPYISYLPLLALKDASGSKSLIPAYQNPSVSLRSTKTDAGPYKAKLRLDVLD